MRITIGRNCFNKIMSTSVRRNRLENEIILSVFDKRKGPTILYSSLKPLDQARKVAVRSFVAIGAGEETQDLSGKHAVVPIPTLDKIAYYYMFRIETKDHDTREISSCWATIGYISDSSSSINFYRSLPLIQEKIHDIVDIIQNNVAYLGEETVLNKLIVQSLVSLKEPIKEKPVTAAPTPATAEVSDKLKLLYDDFRTAELSFLFDYFTEDLDKAIYALLLEEPILIIGEIRDLVQKVVSSLEFLVPHRILSKKYISTYIDPEGTDILICSAHEKFLKKYKNITNVHIPKRQITSKIKGIPSISSLIHTLKIAPIETQKTVIQTYIDKILAKTAQLMELCEKEQINHEEIHQFRSDLKGDELNIVIQMVKRYAPHFEGKLFYFARSLI